MAAGTRTPHVAILPSPGVGHLIPLAELAKRLVFHRGFAATFITFSDFSSPAQDAFLNSLPPGLSSLSLPPVLLDDLPTDARIETRLCHVVARSVPRLRDILATLKVTTPLAAYVIDIFGGDTLCIAKELGVPHYMYCTTNFTVLSLLFYLPTLHRTTSCEYRDLAEPVVLPGCAPIRGEDLVNPMQDRTNEAYTWALHIAGRSREAEGILVNSFVEMEPVASRILMENEPGKPPVWPVGPLIRAGSNDGEENRSECLEWLDRQPSGSVLFVSFGSGGTLSTEQLREVAFGLEMSGTQFLWVVRCPSDTEAYGAFFGDKGADDPLNYLPEGFLERTKGSGLVVRFWAPQVEVLRNGSTGGFLTHCGWNSTLESVVHGVPMIAWPLYAEQRMNAVMLSESVKVAMRPEVGKDGVVRREEISRVVKELMEGEGGKAARDRMAELREAAARALTEEGSSYKSLSEVAGKWKAGIAV
ncbi:hydroquinone glucosyltransferase-like [Phoenix dactylifera]|uniref:Glycosyltransferase n=1 Tax=Phoenix dactylifera TaxID=42345 RepID=A0A8B7BHQ4_PHODC|nr:hydroquinone glucosyltransferase-like [Phoenix dactylifera]